MAEEVTVFGDAETESSGFLERLVGENKSYKSAEDLAKGKVNADEHIKTLEDKLDELREELDKRLSVEDAIKKVQEERQVLPTGLAPTSAQEPSSLKEDDLIDLIRGVTQKDKDREAAQKNRDEVATKLVEVYGDSSKANEAVKQRAIEIGLSVQDLEALAMRSPKAFLTQMGLDVTPQATVRPTHSDVRLPQNSQSQIKEGTESWWKQFRKDSPKEYFSPSMTPKRMKDALRLGDAFFS